MKGFKCWFLGFLGFFVAAIASAFMLAMYWDSTSRVITNNALALLEPLKLEIEQTLKQQKSVKELKLTSESIKSLQAAREYLYFSVLDSGTIVVKIAKSSSLIILYPNPISPESFQWECMGGGSNKDETIPSVCRDPLSTDIN